MKNVESNKNSSNQITPKKVFTKISIWCIVAGILIFMAYPPKVSLSKVEEQALPEYVDTKWYANPEIKTPGFPINVMNDSLYYQFIDSIARERNIKVGIIVKKQQELIDSLEKQLTGRVMNLRNIYDHINFMKDTDGSMFAIHMEQINQMLNDTTMIH